MRTLGTKTSCCLTSSRLIAATVEEEIGHGFVNCKLGFAERRDEREAGMTGG
jgi:hypothetical protein